MFLEKVIIINNNFGNDVFYDNNDIDVNDINSKVNCKS